MINQLLRLSFIAYVWKRYKKLIVSTVLLLLCFWIVALLHQDYSHYAQLNDDKKYLGISFLLKWLSYGVALAVYVYFNRLAGNTTTKSGQQDLLPQGHETEKNTPSDHQEADPFEHLRHKKQLKSKADQLIDKKPPS